jgi:valyl-tRNA synthetase
MDKNQPIENHPIMNKRYTHQTYEQQIYDLWEKTSAFNPDSKNQPAQRLTQTKKLAQTKQATQPQQTIQSKEPTQTNSQQTTTNPAKSFCILMPPPNANDPLHMGHAMFVTLEDILIRYHRMLGDDTLWLPGTDHAGIETQFVFEKKLKQKNKSRFDFNRKKLYQMIWDYVQENSDVAVDQIKKMGASADWSRFKFMLDKDIVKIVTQTFQELANQNLIYRSLKLVNYCTHCGTGFSELEINHVKKKAELYYIKYGPFTLATTRPETKFGDTAVAVHPDDKRYQSYIGQEIEVEGLDGSFKLRVIADEYVDPTFGTGVVKITPAHDFNDFEVWQRHQNEIPGLKQVIDYRGHMTKLADNYAGMYFKKARKEIIKDLKNKGLLVKIDQNYQHSIGTCYRCGTVIQPLPLPQFFIKVKPLTKKALKALDDGLVKVHGAGHHKILKHWLENLRDWNISRQIVWGIRMPVWYSANIPHIHVVFINKKGARIEGKLNDTLDRYKGKYSLDEINSGLQELRAPIAVKYTISPTAPGKNYLQETNTFDTWFSSAQWPYTTLMTSTPNNIKTNGQPNSNHLYPSTINDFKRFYPTSVMETGYDILPFWVMRMLIMGLYKTNNIPFHNIYLHGLIRDAKGNKMSKSKGNVVNPLEITNKYGADALRMALVIRSSAGLDKSVGDGDFKAARNLTNKIWNAARYIMLSSLQNPTTKQAPHDKKFLQQLKKTAQEITHQLDNFLIGLAAETTYNQFWHWFCDECIEKSKLGQISPPALKQGLEVFLKLLHPFVPFVTEAVWQDLQKNSSIKIDNQQNHSLLMLSYWPK